VTAPGYLDAGADLSPDGVHRYSLWRRWGDAPPMTVIGLNPSTADGTLPDPTMTRCEGFARRAGAGGLLMVNLWSYRTKSPTLLRRAAGPAPHAPAQPAPAAITGGAVAEAALLAAVVQAGVVVAAWGDQGAYFDRDREVVALLERFTPFATLYCLGVSKGGRPRHPLYMPADAPLVPFLGAHVLHP
jgi:hypothetical protein